MNHARNHGDKYKDPDEKRLEEQLSGYDLRSIDLCYSEAKSTLDVQLRNIEFLTTKTSNLLAFDGILITGLIALWSVFLKNVPFWVYVFSGASGVLLGISAFCCLIALLSHKGRAFKSAPSPERLLEKYSTWAPNNAKYVIVPMMLRSKAQNEKEIQTMWKWETWGLLFLTFAVVSLVFAFLLLILL